MHTTPLKPRQFPGAVTMHHNLGFSGEVEFHVGDDYDSGVRVYRLPGFIVEAIRDGAVEEVDAWQKRNRWQPTPMPCASAAYARPEEATPASPAFGSCADCRQPIPIANSSGLLVGNGLCERCQVARAERERTTFTPMPCASAAYPRPEEVAAARARASVVIPPASVEFLRRRAEHALASARSSLIDREEQASAAAGSAARAETDLAEAAAHIATLSLTPEGPGDLSTRLADLKAVAAVPLTTEPAPPCRHRTSGAALP